MDESGQDARATGVQSVKRALDLLECLGSAGEPLGLKRLTDLSGLPLATVHRLLSTLSARGYVRQDGRSRKYVLGASVLKLRDPYSRVVAVRAHPFLAELARFSRETANLAVMDGGHVLYVAQAAPERKLRMFTEVGNRLLPHSNAVGKILLAFRPRNEVAGIIERNGLPARTASTITDVDAFWAELERTATSGYAVDNGEEEEDVHCVAVPVFVLAELVAAISVSGPAGRMSRHDRPELVAEMRRLAVALSGALGAPADGSPGDASPYPAGVGEDRG
ncbi:MAG: helix-turn-helix domain-containing protein [Nitriliruptorales bacterium]|nr:helix-turn-helix domain-containing protein [Nitriliruptorales bacterium]